ncbi:dihydrolipoyl dehydrogenase [Neoehrlichia mikurensis]|uniref:Dihydrolipoyl dehydrogenase n=1 Tax=Neoehrlichia mikurensis TaxID=89586 RepID=A0A9Q9F324_9RICK|nr:dihydrolipoyl dehydrogenase [Neoehrlichia mikurensis]QXK92194.1 dihydrolipoyl dehydrogenase [Neoehrlichia mikurensis]QXK92650.1 dihydrolipoyl dehydrogenase [Neoehrlichia mikurensis]QXK93887.1 dihydrolipoyl dehydrogenase [Neoehrlichia mikurensis]UTO55115.1 dihydrolipoyl dehydrogenase [Neoehrlichia mikurensis]UTO56035.1 dihydrolipoyl dehydrogenase [Neoehrlichia mikurensis]
MNQYDFIIIGSGPGGYIAAIRAAQLGYTVAIIEKEQTLGGVCLNWGCIPTKSLLKSVELYQTIKKASSFGLKVKSLEYDLDAIVQRSRQVVDKLSKGINSLMLKNNIVIYYGVAKLCGKGFIKVINNGNSISLSARHIVIATGSRAKNLPNINCDNENIWNAKNAMMPKALPKSLLIIGSGAIGIEFASFYNALGSSVSIIELQNNILPLEDHEISKTMHEILINYGVNIYTNSSITELNRCNNIMQATILTNHNTTTTIACEKVILAVGIQPNTEDLDIKNTNISIDNFGFIITDKYCATSEPNIYAIGDVAGQPCLAHKASHEAILCIEKIASEEKKLHKNIHPLNKNNIPSCIYSIPQIASIGLTEKQAKDKGLKIKVGKFLAQFNGKAIASNDTEGFVKVIFDKITGELLGAHMIGAEVTEMINGYAISKQLEATDYDISSTIFPHPTLSEMMHEAILSANNESLNS